MDLFKVLAGKKTYLIALATIIYAVAGAIAGLHDLKHALELAFGAGGFAALRNGLK